MVMSIQNFHGLLWHFILYYWIDDRSDSVFFTVRLREKVKFTPLEWQHWSLAWLILYYRIQTVIVLCTVSEGSTNLRAANSFSSQDQICPIARFCSTYMTNYGRPINIWGVVFKLYAAVLSNNTKITLKVKS